MTSRPMTGRSWSEWCFTMALLFVGMGLVDHFVFGERLGWGTRIFAAVLLVAGAVLALVARYARVKR